MAFALQLKGPFTALVWAGSQPLLLSVPPALRLLVLVKVFQRSISAIIGKIRWGSRVILENLAAG